MGADGTNQIQATINYLYTLLGVKSENRLNKSEEAVLNGVLVSSFKDFSLNEIKHAFRLALAGTLAVDLYHKLDNIILSQVMNAYRKHKSAKLKTELNGVKSLPEVSSDDQEQIQLEFIENIIQPMWQDFEFDKWEVDKSHWLVYDLLDKKGLANLPPDTKQGCMKLAQKHIASNPPPVDMFGKIIPTELNQQAVVKVAKSFALKQLFFELKLSEMDLIQSLK